MQPMPAKASAARVRLLRREVAAVWVSSCAARKVKLPAARPEMRGLGLGLGLGVGLGFAFRVRIRIRVRANERIN